jgi:hypothetical protein
MKTAGRENPNCWATVSNNRAPGAGGQNTSCSIHWAAKQEKFQPLEMCFFLTSPFIEQIRQVELLPVSSLGPSHPFPARALRLNARTQLMDD